MKNKIIKNAFPSESLKMFSRLLELIPLIAKPEDIIYEKDLIKINNLQNRIEFKLLLEHIRYKLGYDNEVLNMQFLVVLPNKVVQFYNYNLLEEKNICLSIPLQDLVKNKEILFYEKDSNEKKINLGDCLVQNNCINYQINNYTDESIIIITCILEK